MSRHRARLETFATGISRSRQLCDIYALLNRTAPAALDTTDLLRSGVTMCMSALDLLIHSLYLNEASYRYRTGGQIEGLRLSFSCFTASELARERILLDEIYQGNAHKSFMAPDKIGEILSQLVAHPWTKIAAHAGHDEKGLKDRLREIYRWRNRIAHETDINPAFGGIELWPIIEADVRDALNFVSDLGSTIVAVIEAS